MRRFAFVAVLAAVAMIAGCSRSLPDFERMRQQRRATAYGGSLVFSDGMAMRVPPTGTVPHAAASVPVPVTPDLVALGQHHFEIFCAVCHGADGAGRSVMSANMPGIPPPSLLTRQAAQRSDGEIVDLIAHGKNRMPAYGWALAAEDRWAVTAYVRTLQQRQAAEAVPSSEPGR